MLSLYKLERFLKLRVKVPLYKGFKLGLRLFDTSKRILQSVNFKVKVKKAVLTESH